MPYEPATYWEARLKENFNSVGVGHKSFTPAFNDMLYRVRRYRLKRVMDSLGINVTTARVLDIGCGTGFFIGCFQAWGCPDVTGLDITEVSVSNLSQQYPQYRFQRQDISEAADLSPLGQFDVINCFDVMIHIVDPGRFETAMRQIARLLKPGGVFLCSDVYPEEDQMMDGHVVFHSLASYRQALSPHATNFVALHPLIRWGFSNHPALVNLFNTVPQLAEFLDKYCLTLPMSRVKLGVFQKKPN